MPKKDFLEQFSTNNVPDSYKQEELKPVNKKINPVPFIVLGVVLLVLLGVGIFLFIYLNRPTIEVPNFIGKKSSEVVSWIKQQEIEASGIVYKEEYSDDVEEKIIISQSIEEGIKVKKDIKMDFTVSLGPDPNASISVPDISSMNLDSIKSWIDDNKLRGVKLNYEFSDTDPLDSVISFVFGNGVNESNFIRTSSLTITISKGKQSDQAISVPNFIGKNVSEVETWGSKNKIKIIKKEEFSSTVQKDMVVSQSVNVGKKITSKESLTVNISRGEAIYAPDFKSYSRENIDAWAIKNLVNVAYTEEYNSSVEKGKVIKQDHVGEPVNDGMTVTLSLGTPSKDDFTGTTVDELRKWIDSVNKYGAGLSVGNVTYEIHETIPAGQIISMSSFTTGSSIKVTVSKGRNIFLKDTETLSWSSILADPHYTEFEIRELIAAQDPAITNVKYEYDKSKIYEVGQVIDIKLKGDGVLEKDNYISQSSQIIITICEEKINNEEE